MKKTKILIIGAGRIGQALAQQLKKTGQAVALWDKDPKKRVLKTNLKSLVASARLILITAPSWATRDIATEIKPFLKSHHIIISLAKGLEDKESQTVPEIWEKLVDGQCAVGFMAGPMLAEELQRAEMSWAEIGLNKPRAFFAIKKIFNEIPLRLSYCPDLLGLSWCALLKNIYAVGFGILDELGYGTNIKSCLTLHVISETTSLIKKFGGHEKTFYGPAGLGDLLTTGWGTLSYNYNTGRQIAKTSRPAESEGTRSLKNLGRRLGFKIKNYPILAGLYEIIIKHKPHRPVMEKILHHLSCQR